MSIVKKMTTMLVGMAVMTGSLFAGGSSQSGGQQAASPTARAPASQREASMLAQKVAAKTLPALEQRLPTAGNIMVETMDSIGSYGDHLTFTFDGRSSQWYYGMIGEEPLFRFTMQGSVEPNVAKGYIVNANATEYTIYLREGMKWSDGHPFTADDCIFFYEHMILTRSFGNAIYQCYYSTNPRTGEQSLCTMEKVNDYEFKVKFKDPSPTFLEQVAIDTKWMFAPAHYYKTLLPEFIGEAAAAAKAKELGFADVAAMGRQTGYYYWNNIDRPVVRPWKVMNNVDSDLMIMERNPYYWKTDAEGKQLPYIDQLQFVRVSDVNQVVLMTMDGSIDVAPGLPFSQIATLNQNQNRGGYRLLRWDTTNWAGTGHLQFNQSSEDLKLRAVFANKDFRKAISISADRKEMAELVSDGWSQPSQSSPVKGAMGYSEAWSTKWTEYNPTEAKRLLEQSVGLRMGADGFYRFSDNTPFTLEIITSDDSAECARAAELLTEKYLKNIGIKATVAVRDAAYVNEMRQANKVNVILDSSYAMATVNVALRADNLVPVRNNFTVWYGAFGTWFATNGEGGETTTGEIMHLIDLYREMRAATTRAEVDRKALEILKVHEENLWEIAFLSPTPVLIGINKDLRNFRETGIYCDEFRSLGIAHPAIWYLAQ